MRFLVTGAQGFLGSEIVKQLPDTQVVATGKRPANDVYCCDLTDASAVRTMMEEIRPDRLIHCAAYVPQSQADYASAEQADKSLLMLGNLLAAASCPVVFISSMTVYGVFSGRPVREEDAGSPVSAYGVGKWQAEQLLHTHAHPTLAVRIPGLFGPTRRTGLVNNVVYALRQGTSLPTLPDTPLIWAAMHVRDAALGVVRLSYAKFTPHQAINLGYPGEFAIDILLQLAAELFDTPIPYSLTHPRFAFDLSRALALGAAPHKSLREALLEFSAEL